MKKLSWIAAAVLAAGAGCAATEPDTFPVIQTQSDFLDVCEQEWVQREPSAASWARSECQVKWQWAMASGSMATAILSLSVAEGDAPRAPEDAQVAIQGELEVELNALFLLGNGSEETTTYTLRIRDRAGNWSNTIITPTITIVQGE